MKHKRIDVNQCNKYGQTPLLIAACDGNELADILYERDDIEIIMGDNGDHNARLSEFILTKQRSLAEALEESKKNYKELQKVNEEQGARIKELEILVSSLQSKNHQDVNTGAPVHNQYSKFGSGSSNTMSGHVHTLENTVESDPKRLKPNSPST